MSQQELAEKVGVSKQTIFIMEKGNYTPALLLVFQIMCSNFMRHDFPERIYVANFFLFKYSLAFLASRIYLSVRYKRELDISKNLSSI